MAITVQTFLQPFVHDLITTVCAPSVTLSAADGQIRGTGAQGFLLGEHRMLSVFKVMAFGREPEVIHTHHTAAGLFEVVAVVRDGSEPTPDPSLLLTRRRQQHATGFTEVWTLTNHGLASRQVDLHLYSATDFADTSHVKGGRPMDHSYPALATPDGLCYRHDGLVVTVRATGGPSIAVDDGLLRWSPAVAARDQTVITIDVQATSDHAAFQPSPIVPWQVPVVECSDERLAALVEWGFHDLASLALTDNDSGDTFVGAGSPWFLTLFGRDSLWAARMLMPFSVDLAASTLRALARRQGVRVDVSSAEHPGRILHEVRTGVLKIGTTVLPPLYYGSIDATPLWMTTLTEAWRWGMSSEAVIELLPAMQAAVRWLIEDSDADGDGLLEYIDTTGSGLSNQGWKDSGDSVSWIDGRLAEPPIALAEAQGYAYRAAHDAAELLDHFGLPGGNEARSFASRLRDEFNRMYWISDARGDYIAVALDGHKQPVDSVTTNPGHLLGTGLLNADQEAVVVHRLMTDLACPAGLRTLAPSSARFSPISYHNGSIWPHDLAICARGMMLGGFPAEAAEVIRGLLVAVETFGGRLPELYSYDTDLGTVLPYPASCRPQAWSAVVGAVALWAAAPILPGPDGPISLAPAPIVDRVDISGFVCRGQQFRVRNHRGEIVITAL